MHVTNKLQNMDDCEPLNKILYFQQIVYLLIDFRIFRIAQKW